MKTFGRIHGFKSNTFSQPKQRYGLKMQLKLEIKDALNSSPVTTSELNEWSRLLNHICEMKNIK